MKAEDDLVALSSSFKGINSTFELKISILKSYLYLDPHLQLEALKIKVDKAGKRLLYAKRNKAIPLGKGASKISREVHSLFLKGLYLDFQDSPGDEADTRSSHEYLNDLEEEYQTRALLAKSKRFFKKEDCWSKTLVSTYQSPFQPKPLSSSQHKPKLRPTKDFEAKYNKVKAKLALLSSSSSASKASMVKNKGLIAEAYEWDEEEVSSDDNEMVEVKVLMALAEKMCCSKEVARNSEWGKDLYGERTCDHAEYISTMNMSQHLKSLGRMSSIPNIPRPPKRFFPPCIHCGGIDHLSNECLYYPISRQAKKDKALKSTRAESSNANRSKTPTKRLAHQNFKTINKLSKQNLVIGIPSLVYSKDKPCSSCEKGKHHRASFKTKQTSSIKKCLHLLHIDLFGPVTPRSINHEKYTLSIVDKYSRYTWVYFLKKKSQEPETIMSFIKRVENQNDIKIKQLRTDNGTEFRNSTLVNFCDEKGISQNFSSPYTLGQNGVAERKNRTLIESARTMLSGSVFSKQYWIEAVAIAFDNTNTAESERYPPDEYLENEVSSDQNDQTDQNDQPVQNYEIFNDDHSEHSNHTNKEQIIDSLPNTEDIQISEHLSSPNTEDTLA
ncbi:retrovirus-related pol polyprotein from transposon TNT 1-94 [Tanacetum coccineum]